jgi:hypothetical protein
MLAARPLGALELGAGGASAPAPIVMLPTTAPLDAHTRDLLLDAFTRDLALDAHFHDLTLDPHAGNIGLND